MCLFQLTTDLPHLPSDSSVVLKVFSFGGGDGASWFLFGDFRFEWIVLLILYGAAYVVLRHSGARGRCVFINTGTRLALARAPPPATLPINLKPARLQ